MGGAIRAVSPLLLIHRMNVINQTAVLMPMSVNVMTGRRRARYSTPVGMIRLPFKR